ncbi:hypothetical protein TWF718_004905 [Orbilia javanica]|uniref:F-box domain-containing protein n=1 Tax=Orbilia javanica TaxID=47235 RepID=A0AAN8RLB5_9PEZI
MSDLPQLLPDLPLEVQYLILECSDWLQQSVLRQVCRTWQHYIDTSDTLLDDCYKTSVPQDPAGEEEPREGHPFIPRFHNIVEYRSAFVRTPTGFTPCILHKNENGEVVDWSPEADLTIYLSDPLLKPGTTGYIEGMDICGDMADVNADPNGVTLSYETLSTCSHGSVDSYLRDTCKGMAIVGRAINRKYFKTSLSWSRVDGNEIRLKLLIESESEACADEQAGALISQLSISQAPSESQ